MRKQLNITFLLLCSALLMVASLSCRKRPEFPRSEGVLSFSEDTIRFDTMFSTFLSPSERLHIYNANDFAIEISSIRLQNGQNSEYKLMVDGIEQNEISNLVIAANDSLRLFAALRSQLRDNFSRDKILFTIGNNTQIVELEAYQLDAHFYKDSTLLQGAVIDFYPDKPHVIDGCLLIPPTTRVNIHPGTTFHFTARKDSLFNLASAIKVLGTIDVRGEKGNEVIFQGLRFEEEYQENPGQYRGLIIAEGSTNNRIRHAIIKNGLIGIEVQFPTGPLQTKLQLKETEIRNMAGYGILGIGYVGQPLEISIQAQNCLIHNCKEATLAIFGGGNYRFWNCTFANYALNFNRQGGQVIINNYDLNPGQSFSCEADFKNCIIWGSEEDELILDASGSSFDVNFQNSIVRTTQSINGANNLISQVADFPQFIQPETGEVKERNYRLQANSPAIDAGVNLQNAYQIDLDATVRTLPFDIGAYESKQ